VTELVAARLRPRGLGFKFWQGEICVHYYCPASFEFQSCRTLTQDKSVKHGPPIRLANH
jgi:hypothetical protein